MSSNATAYIGEIESTASAELFPYIVAHITISGSVSTTTASGLANIEVSLSAISAQSFLNFSIRAVATSVIVDKKSFSIVQKIYKNKFSSFRIVHKIKQENHARIIRREI